MFKKTLKEIIYILRVCIRYVYIKCIHSLIKNILLHLGTTLTNRRVVKSCVQHKTFLILIFCIFRALRHNLQ